MNEVRYLNRMHECRELVPTYFLPKFWLHLLLRGYAL